MQLTDSGVDSATHKKSKTDQHLLRNVDTFLSRCPTNYVYFPGHGIPCLPLLETLALRGHFLCLFLFFAFLLKDIYSFVRT